MNAWGGDQFGMPNMMGMPGMMPGMGAAPMNSIMMGDMNVPQMQPMVVGNVPPLIGPVMPENHQMDEGEMLTNEQRELQSSNVDSNYHKKQDNRKENRETDRHDKESRPRHERRSRERHDRNDRSEKNERHDKNDKYNRNDRSSRSERSRRDKRSKWDHSEKPALLPLPTSSLMMPNMSVNSANSMMAYQNMMGQPSMEMNNMVNMQNMATMPSMQNNMASNMMQNMNMMNNMMDPNMMMMNQQSMMMTNQAIYVSNGILLPMVPGSSMPNRREKPPGCKTIFVGGLPNNLTEENIREVFYRFGNITDVKLHQQGFAHVRFDNEESMEQAFYISGYRYKCHDQTENEATTIFVDYALNRDDQAEYEHMRRMRQSPVRIEPLTPATLVTITEKIKSEEHFAEAAPTLASWLERGECNKKNANSLYSLIQASNNQVRRLFNEKMILDEEFHNMKSSIRDKFARILSQFEQVAKILTAAKHQRVSDHFSKQQRRNIEMWLKMSEEVDNIREEFNTMFDEDDDKAPGHKTVPEEKYEELKRENENLMYELEGYRNEVHLAKDEAERKFEKFKAHFIAQQALQNKQTVFPPLPPPPMPNLPIENNSKPPKPQPPPPTPDDDKVITSGPVVPPSEAKLISILTAFLMVHPLGASLDYLVSYVRSMVPSVTQATVHQTLQKYTDVFTCKTSGVGATIEHRWMFLTFDIIKNEV